jgi:hypothetical protein
MTNPLSKWFRIPPLSERLRHQGVREDIVAAAERTAFSRQSDRGLAALAEILTDSEGVIALVEGRLAKSVGLLVLTSRRLVFQPADSGRESLAVELPDIQSVQWRKHRGMGVIEVSAGTASLLVDQILGNQAETLTRSIEQARNPPPDGPREHRDPLDQLAELRALHHAGVIGDAEFQARKQELFGQI